jgi:hypothetical protein
LSVDPSTLKAQEFEQVTTIMTVKLMIAYAMQPNRRLRSYYANRADGLRGGRPLDGQTAPAGFTGPVKM